MKGYNPEEGFIVYWDYTIGIINNEEEDLLIGKNLKFIVSIVCEG